MHDEQQVGVTVVDTQAQPRTISAKTGEKAHIHMNTNVQNIIEVQNSRYVTLAASSSRAARTASA